MVDRSELDGLLEERSRAWEAWEQALSDLIATGPAGRSTAIGTYRSARAHFYEVHESLEAHLISLLREQA